MGNFNSNWNKANNKPINKNLNIDNIINQINQHNNKPMKHSILQYTKQHIQEAKEYQHPKSDIASYLINTAQSEENGYLEYLTNEEIEDFENNPIEYRNEIENFIYENFNYNFEDFIY